MIALIKEGLRVIAEALGLINRRTDLKNAADVKAAQKSQNEISEQSRIESKVANRDESIRNDIAE